MIFYTADPHFGYEPLVAARGFESAAQMDAALIDAWNGVVSPADTVYLVGDIGWNNGHVPCRTLSRLNGQKHLIRGNHDTGYRDAVLLYRYFETVTDFLEIDDGPHHIFLSHYPMLFSKPNGYMIHGHLHAGGQFHEILRTLPRVLNAGVDINGFAPVTLAQLIENNERFYSQAPESRPYHRTGKGLLPGIPDFQPIPPRPGPHPKHLFLTGRKQVGKSTVLGRLLEGRDEVLGGFRTKRVRTGGGADVYMLPPTGVAGFLPENLLFRRRAGKLELDPAAFDRLGIAMLERSRDAGLLLMDELGPTELEAHGFQQAVRTALDSGPPVYGVLQQADSPFLAQIAAREDVCVITVTEENREDLPRLLLEQGW